MFSMLTPFSCKKCFVLLQTGALDKTLIFFPGSNSSIFLTLLSILWPSFIIMRFFFSIIIKIPSGPFFSLVLGERLYVLGLMFTIVRNLGLLWFNLCFYLKLKTPFRF